MKFKTVLHYRITHRKCKAHCALAFTVPLAEAGSQLTLLFETYAALVMKQVPSLRKSATLIGISLKEVRTSRKHAVMRVLEHRIV